MGVGSVEPASLSAERRRDSRPRAAKGMEKLGFKIEHLGPAETLSGNGGGVPRRHEDANRRGAEYRRNPANSNRRFPSTGSRVPGAAAYHPRMPKRKGPLITKSKV